MYTVYRKNKKLTFYLKIIQKIYSVFKILVLTRVKKRNIKLPLKKSIEKGWAILVQRKINIGKKLNYFYSVLTGRWSVFPKPVGAVHVAGQLSEGGHRTQHSTTIT